MVEVPCRDMDDPKRKTTTMRLPMILPHELLSYLTVIRPISVLYPEAVFFVFSWYIHNFLFCAFSCTFQEKNKIHVIESDKATYWQHFRTYMGDHPALDHHDANPQSSWHQPIGLFGDDAKYTLAGRKIVVLLLSSVLQRIARSLAFIINGQCSSFSI